MQVRSLGTQGLSASALGLGCMGMSWAYGEPDERESVETIRRALDLGITFFDTAEVYGPYANERLLGRALGADRDRAVIATKFGFRIVDGRIEGLDSSPGNVRRVCEAALERLGTDRIDLLYQHRVDPDVPIEDTVGAMAELVREGKVRFLGLSEASAATLERAHAVHPISALQSEYSLFERGIEASVLPACRRLGIGLVPYSPLGRAFLTGQAQRAEEYSARSDFRAGMPRFQGENYDRNLRLVEALKGIAANVGATPAQVALAWLLRQGEDIVPIPGTKRRRWLEENAAAAALSLPGDVMAELDRVFAPEAVSGERYAPVHLRYLDR
ncbi:MAG: aldo/keto reductase [Steroidobacteraceae bacterium]|jgi:aryl-alcohol dehydrogenase-like predicted oxidoreductase|nr:aldo/keto reductase [Steroidobacteraceae bacterium]